MAALSAVSETVAVSRSGASSWRRAINFSSEIGTRAVRADRFAFFRAIPTSQQTVTAFALALAVAETAASVANSASSKDGVADIRVLAVVEPERKFIQIQRQILLAHVVIGANYTALEQRPKALNVVRVDLATDILASAVLDRFMANVAVQIIVGLVLICRDQSHLIVNYIADEARQSACILIADNAADHVALASDSADDSSFAVAYGITERLRASHLALLAALFVPMAIAIFPAYIGFVRFDNATQRKHITTHRGANPCAHIPSSLIGAGSDHPMYLVGGHAFLRVQHEEDHTEPFSKRIVRVLEDGSRDNGEAIAVLLVTGRNQACLFIDRFLAALAQIVMGPRLEPVALRAATRTLDYAIRPAPPFEVVFAGFLSGEAGQQLAQFHLANNELPLRIHNEEYSALLGRCQMPDNRHLSAQSGLKGKSVRLCSHRCAE